MVDKEFCKTKYLELKSKNGGKPPKRDDYLRFCGINDRIIDKLFGSNSYSKLQKECGDAPNKLTLTRTPLFEIFIQWGELARQHGRIPTQADWLEAGCKPGPTGLAKRPHYIKWPELPNRFLDYARNKNDWFDVIAIIKSSNAQEDNASPHSRNLEELVSIIKEWTPDRKRIIEEGYKIELRKYLQGKKYILEEETGESRPDLLVNRIYPIELKKDPSLSEYDRLFGQLIRHSLLFGSAIAVITDTSSLDRFNKFSQNVEDVFQKLGVSVRLIRKGT